MSKIADFLHAGCEVWLKCSDIIVSILILIYLNLYMWGEIRLVNLYSD
jgi:hypothetical protein